MKDGNFIPLFLTSMALSIVFPYYKRLKCHIGNRGWELKLGGGSGTYHERREFHPFFLTSMALSMVFSY